MLKSLITKAKNNHLVKSSAIFLIGSTVAGLSSYLYHLFMGRMLPIVEYGELQSLISIFLIIYLPAMALTLVVTRYSSHHHTPNELGKTKSLLKALSKKFTYLGVAIFLLLAIFSKYIASYLQIKEPLKVIEMSLIFIFIFLSSINKGVLQGLQRFKELSWVVIIETSSKLFFGIILVWLGWQIYGAIGAFVLGAAIGYFYSFLPINKSFSHNVGDQVISKDELKDLTKYILPVFFSLLGIALLLTMDLILAKHYFAPQLAGAYSGLSIMGRVIFWITLPLISVLFSVSARQHKEKENYRRSFLLSFIIISSIGLAATLIYFLIPNLIIQLLLGKKYLYISQYLGWYALAVTLICLINLIVNFLLSIKMTKCVYWVLGGVALQFVGITIWHNDIGQLIWVMNIVMSAILAGLFYYYFRFHDKST